MKCKEVKPLLLRYLDNAVNPGERISIESHLSACPGCRGELDELAATERELRQAFRTMAAEVSPAPCGWDRLQQHLDAAGQPEVTIWNAVKSKAKGGSEMLREFVARQPAWKTAVAGVLLLALIVGLSITVPSLTGKSDIALAAEIARNSPQVKAALGGGDVEAVETMLLDKEGIVICIAEMQFPIAVRVDLKGRKVIEITDVSLPELTEFEEEAAIEIAKSTPIVQEFLGKASIENIEAYPFFTSGMMETEEGKIKLLPAPRMAIVEFDLDEGQEIIRAKINLDAKAVNEVGRYQDGNAMYPSSAVSTTTIMRPGSSPPDIHQAIEEAQAKASELIDADPIGKAILAQGFNKEHIFVINSPTRLKSDTGVKAAVDIPTSAIVILTLEEKAPKEEAWEARVDLISESVEWMSAPEKSIEYDPSLDIKAEETAMSLLRADPQIAELLEKGARVYTSLAHSLEYSITSEGEAIAMSVPERVLFLIILGDDLWQAEVDLSVSEVTNFEITPPNYRLAAKEKEAVVLIAKAEPEVKKLLDAGAQIIYVLGGEVKGHKTISRMASAVLHLDGSLWFADVNLDDMTFHHLGKLD